MAILQMPVNNNNPFADVLGDALAPPGTFVATVLDIRDEFGVQRTKFQSTEIETVDLTCFLLGFFDQQGFEHRVSSRRMKISGNEKSSLFAFLKCLLGRAPQYGWDYMALKGAQCLVTVEHIGKRDGTGVFAAIAALSPVPAGFGQPAPQVAAPRPAVMGPVAGVPSPTPIRQGGVPAVTSGRPAAMAPRPLNAPPGGPAYAGPSAGAPVAGMRPVAPAAVVAADDPLPF